MAGKRAFRIVPLCRGDKVDLIVQAELCDKVLDFIGKLLIHILFDDLKLSLFLGDLFADEVAGHIEIAGKHLGDAVVHGRAFIGNARFGIAVFVEHIVVRIVVGIGGSIGFDALVYIGRREDDVVHGDVGG